LVFFIGAVPLVENEKPWEIPWLPVAVPEGQLFGPPILPDEVGLKKGIFGKIHKMMTLRVLEAFQRSQAQMREL